MRAFLIRHQWLFIAGNVAAIVANLICIYASPKAIDYSYSVLGFLWGMIFGLGIAREMYRGGR